MPPEALEQLILEVRTGHHRGGKGCHGVVHWARVLENGLRLAELTGANAAVVTLFAAFHDCRRQNDHHDAQHGKRGGALARSMRGKWFDLTDAEMDLLEYACAHHTSGLTVADPTVQACWDADRLDLPRVSITVSPKLLCTPAARDPALIAWATDRARRDHIPDFARSWLV